MTPQRGNTRIFARSGAYYMVVETVDEVMDQIRTATDGDPWVALTSVNGSDMFEETEALMVRAEDCLTVQAISNLGWAWQQEINTLHYARQLQDLRQSANDRMVEVQRDLVNTLKAQHGEGEAE